MTTEHTTITPVGTVISYHGITAPEGYFACDGAEFDAAVYPKLAAVLGESKVPDLRGYFIRGYDTSNDVDTNGAGRELGSEQGDAIRNITAVSNLYIPANATGGASQVMLGIGSISGAFYAYHKDFTGNLLYFPPGGTLTGKKDIVLGFDASKQVPTADENRPKNVNLLYCIKHDEPEMPAPQPVIPDLRIGRETLWPMRYQGKQVYAKLINFGALPNGTGLRGTTHGIVDLDWCQISWDYSCIRKNNDANLTTLGPVSTPVPNAVGAMYWRFLVDKTSVQANSIYNNTVNADWSAVICVLYTKTTDEPLP